MLKTPPLQTATATIDTLCGRLQSATLLEDRRAAILGLRSFAKQYPASVASGSVRELVATLRRDGLGEKSEGDDAGKRGEGSGGDVDTIRLVLETILMLFNPDSNSPEAGDEIAFFMADEFSVRQDNMLLLLNLLDPTSPHADYYSRKYAVDILSAICAARPERLQECILSAPLGISRLVGVLDDGRDAVRNAGLLLLVDLTNGASEDLRKIVAFEDVYGKVFALIRTEGGLAEAGITAQDCLSLLANLVKGSSSNQTMFRESGCFISLLHLVREAFPPQLPEAAFIAQSREKSTFGLLQLLRLFLVAGEPSTSQNQASFFRAGGAQVLIDLGFSSALPTAIRTACLTCVAELIAHNPPLQEAFAGMTVVTPADAKPQESLKPQTNGTRSSTPAPKVSSTRESAEESVRTYIIEALLDLTLDQPQEDLMLRAAGCRGVQAYLTQHDRIRAHFLQRAISGHAQRESAANVLITLAQPGSDMSSLIFASWIVQDLIADNLEAKAALLSVQEGNETEGEDLLSFIQTLGSQLQQGLQQSADGRLIASYATLLTLFVWDYPQGVDDLLAEGSGLLQLLSSTPRLATVDPLVAGLACVLFGTVYEFSTKDSPVPRRTLAPLLTQKLTRSIYLDALAELRRNPVVRDFDIPEVGEDAVLLCKAFVDLFSVEYSRLRKAIDKDPGIEVLPQSAAEAGVDRDILDDLRQQLQSAKDALATSQQEALSASQKHEQDLLSAQKDQQSTSTEVERLRRINDAMQKGHENELEKITAQHTRQKQDLTAEHQQALVTARQESQHQVRQATQQTESSFSERIKEFERRIAELGNTHRSEQSAHTKTRQQLESLTAKYSDVSMRESGLNQQHTELVQTHTKLEREHKQLQNTTTQSQSQLQQVQKELESRNAEVERLNAQSKELRDEVQGKEAELATERAGFADLEKELESAKTSLKKAENKKGSTKDSAANTQKLARVEKELAEAKAEAQSSKEELESMLLVMGDIEAKRDGYRAKVKELGGEVTDDEEDEEDEDEDEDEDVDEDVD